MATSIEYTGLSHVRILEPEDILAAYDIEHPRVMVDSRIRRDVVVSDQLAAVLIGDGEWEAYDPGEAEELEGGTPLPE